DAAQKRGVGLVPLVTPTTTTTRVARIATLADTYPVPFVYYVSVTGVTGGASALDALAQAGEAAGGRRGATKRPTVVGFGIDSAERARAAAVHADGVVVGSEIVRRIERGETPSGRIDGVRELVRELRAAL